jgi:outer membrane murein-binding lipoprotein Lpp
MSDAFSQSQVIAVLVALLVGSYAAFLGWIVSSIHRLDAKIDVIDLRLNAKIDALDRKFEAKFDAVNALLETVAVAVARLEGAVYHGLPEPRRAE